MLSSHRTVSPAITGSARLATGAPAASSRSTGSASGESILRTPPPEGCSPAATVSSRADAAAPSEATSSGPWPSPPVSTPSVAGGTTVSGRPGLPSSPADGSAVPAAAPTASAPTAAASAGASSCVSLPSRHSTNWPSSFDDTSAITPRPNWATRPVTVRSVTTDTAVPSPSGWSWAVMVAAALPWPRVSRPSARSTIRRAASSFSTNRAAPLYWAVTGPTFTLTMPRYSSPSTSWSCAPGMQGAISSTSVSTSQARSTGTPTRKSFVSSMGPPGSAPLGEVLDGVDVGGPPRTRYLRDEVRSATHHHPGAGVARLRQQRPHHRRQPHRVAPHAVVGGHRDRRRGGPGHPAPGLRLHERLVAQADDHGGVAVPAGPGDARLQRGRDPVPPGVVAHDDHP